MKGRIMEADERHRKIDVSLDGNAVVVRVVLADDYAAMLTYDTIIAGLKQGVLELTITTNENSNT